MHFLLEEESVRTQEPSHTASVVPGPKVVVAGFGVAFFAGEVEGGETYCECANGMARHSAIPSRRRPTVASADRDGQARDLMLA